MISLTDNAVTSPELPVAIATCHSQMLHEEDKPQSFPPRLSSSSYCSRRQLSRCFTPPSPTSSLPLDSKHISSSCRLNGPHTIHPLNKAPTPNYPSSTACSHLIIERSTLLSSHTCPSSYHFTSDNPCASHQTAATSHSTSSIEDWIDKTSPETPTPTLVKPLEEIPTAPQPSPLTSPSFLQRKGSLAPAGQDSHCAGPPPLTKRLLRLHTNNMADQGIYRTPTKEDAQRKAAEPPTSSSGSSGSNTNPRWVRRRMEDHHIYRDSGAFDHAKYGEFKEHVISTISPERHSAVKPGEASNFKEIYKTCVNSGVTEATFKREMLKHVIKDDFQVLAQQADPAQGIQAVYESRNLFRGGIFCQAEQPLRRGFLPHNCPTNLPKKDLGDRLKIDGMANSEPDSTWGYLARVLDPIPTGAMMQHQTKTLLTICPPLYCPFFFIEVKPDNGSMEECRNQAARGCATIVNAMRLLLGILGREETIGPDQESYIYCATMNEDLLEYWVGWAEVCEGGQVNWHMDRLQREDFMQDNPLLVMRRFAHNILEWGLETRLPIIKKLVSDLYVTDTMLLAEEGKKGLPTTPSTGKKRKEMHSTSIDG